MIIKFRLKRVKDEIVEDLSDQKQERFCDAAERYRVQLTDAQEKIMRICRRGVKELILNYKNTYEATEVIPVTPYGFKRLGGDNDTAGLYYAEYDVALLRYKEGYKNEGLPWWSRLKQHSHNHAFMHTVVHEMVHGQSYRAVQAFKKDKKTIVTAPHRSGVSICRLGDPSNGYFHDLNEAITEVLTGFIIDEIFEEAKPWLPDYLEDRDEFPNSYRTYCNERKVLKRLVKVLARRNKSEEDEIWEIFFNTYFFGDMVPLGRLIDKTFGKSTFRLVGTDLFSPRLNELLNLRKKIA